MSASPARTVFQSKLHWSNLRYLPVLVLTSFTIALFFEIIKFSKILSKFTFFLKIVNFQKYILKKVTFENIFEKNVNFEKFVNGK